MENITVSTASLLCLFVLLSSLNIAHVVEGKSSMTRKDTAMEQEQKQWCVAKPSASDEELVNNIQYVCTEQGLNCSSIQQGGACSAPDTVINHASVVMNLYYQKAGRHPHNCDFMNSGLIVVTDPSYRNCTYA